MRRQQSAQIRDGATSVELELHDRRSYDLTVLAEQLDAYGKAVVHSAGLAVSSQERNFPTAF